MSNVYAYAESDRNPDYAEPAQVKQMLVVWL